MSQIFQKKPSDEALLQQVKHAVQHEREATQVVLEYLLEVERRRLFLKLGYPSLFDFCVRELGYCGGSAHLRIQAMRLLRDVSQSDREAIVQKISSGTLTLSQLSNIQTYSRQVLSHRVQPEQKIAILKKLEGQPTRESQKIILGELGLAGAAYERMRVRGPDQVELTVTLDAAAVELLEEWKALTSHSNPEGRNSEALRGALQLAVERARKEKGLRRSPSAVGGSDSASSSLHAPLHAHEVKDRSNAPIDRCESETGANFKIAHSTLPRAIPISIKRLVWARDEARCTYRDLRSGKRCDGKHYLEIDHIMPRAQGGKHELRNLRLLCSGHHRLRHLS